MLISLPSAFVKISKLEGVAMHHLCKLVGGEYLAANRFSDKRLWLTAVDLSDLALANCRFEGYEYFFFFTKPKPCPQEHLFTLTAVQ